MESSASANGIPWVRFGKDDCRCWLHPHGILDEPPPPSAVGAMRTAGIDLNKPRSARSSPQPPPWPRVIKRGRRNSYRIKRPRDTITRHDTPPEIHIYAPAA